MCLNIHLLSEKQTARMHHDMFKYTFTDWEKNSARMHQDFEVVSACVVGTVGQGLG